MLIRNIGAVISTGTLIRNIDAYPPILSDLSTGTLIHNIDGYADS
jgi:hypothetical protein